jgi:flavin-dependent dehydrogenase
VVIVGSGPAGAATALGLVAREPAMAAEVLVLEKARHPRPKTCAGGLIPKTLRLLRALDLDVDAVPNVRVDRAAVVTPHGTVAVPGRDLCRVVRRSDFDAMLASAVRDRGVELREGVQVREVTRDGDRVRIETDAGTVSASVVVGADGSGSLVRRRLVPGAQRLARAVMRDLPLGGSAWDGHAARRYEFDFRCLGAGVSGYAWAFPTLVDGRPCANVGAYALAPADAGAVRAAMDACTARVAEIGDAGWKAFPIRLYQPGVRVAAERVVLVGDAAGVEALLGEGISFSLEYGMLAAEALVVAHRTSRWDFEDYQRAVERGPLGRKLAWLATAARHFYGPRWSWWFRAAHASSRAQRLALAWYNGEPDVEGLGRWRLAARLLRAPAVAA